MRPPIALTCGEPAGIGPEIAYKAWEILKGTVPFFYIGDPTHLPKGSAFEIIKDPADAWKSNALPVYPFEFFGPVNLGEPNSDHACDVLKVIEHGVKMVREGAASALCTGPIHKAALKDGAGFKYPGHTEYLAALTDTTDVEMMLAGNDLRVVPATIHIPLSNVPAALTAERLTNCIQTTYTSLVNQFNIPNPRIAVAGLNPHAGENGYMGHEDKDIIQPVIESFKTKGLQISGPLSADTMFHPKARETYDVAICMYHDQALIPVKTITFDEGVNVTLGLPIIRTSPDHGTALDIAGKNCANPASLIAALKLAYSLSND